MASRKELVVPKVWRSEWQLLLGFVLLCVASVVFSNRFPESILSGPIFSFAGFTILLELPLFWLLPLSALGAALLRIYNVRYTLDQRGIQSRVGIFSRRIMRLRFEDVRSVEIAQSLVDRFFNIGTVYISTASTELVELHFSGIGAPLEVQRMIECERDRRKDLLRESPGPENRNNYIEKQAQGF
jgi:uncharacterized membrane protein YdbT with pleckstrin-like domain